MSTVDFFLAMHQIGLVSKEIYSVDDSHEIEICAMKAAWTVIKQIFADTHEVEV